MLRTNTDFHFCIEFPRKDLIQKENLKPYRMTLVCNKQFFFLSVNVWKGNRHRHGSAVVCSLCLALSLTHCLLIINRARHRNRSFRGIGRWARPKDPPSIPHTSSADRKHHLLLMGGKAKLAILY